MKKYLFIIILSLLISFSASARKVGCKEGNCENGFGLWVSTDGTTYEGEWAGTKKMGKELKLGLMDIFTKVDLKTANGVDKEF